MKKLIFLSIVLGFLSQSHAQSWSRVSRCEDLGLDPSVYDYDTGGNRRLLEIYLEGDGEGLGGHGCWVFHHRNGKDYVVTPHSWWPNLQAGKKGLIEDALQAITDSRNVYEIIGDLHESLYYILDDVYYSFINEEGIRESYTGEKFYTFNNKCWMLSGAPTLRGSEGLPADRRYRMQTFAHEIGHCFVEKNVTDLWTSGNDSHWFNESVSDYLSALVYPSYNVEHNSSQDFDMDGAPFQQEYSAWVLWYYYAQRYGNPSIVPLMNNLASRETRSMRLSFLRGIGFDELFHQFLFDFYKERIVDPLGTVKVPSESVVLKRQPEMDLIAYPNLPLELDSIPPERMSLYSLFIPPDHDLIIKPPINSSKKAHFSIFTDNMEIRKWTSPERIEGNCGSFTQVMIIASHLNENAVTGTKITYDLEERVGCCETNLVVEANPGENELDGRFAFDHYIESDVNYAAGGDAARLPLNYYVNSKDGSMLLDKSWFNTAFGTDSNMSMEVNAVIWLANGQLVGYVYDKHQGQNRAITLDLNQTRGDIMAIRAMNIAQLLREGYSSSVQPAPLPAGSIWAGKSTGLAFNQPERSDPGQINKISAYISDEPSPFTSPMSSFGFMAGHIRDRNNKNKKLVYSRFDLPNGDMFEVHLNAMEKRCYSFDGAGYEKMTIGSSTGAIAAMSMAEREEFVEKGDLLQARTMLLLKELENCRGNKTCEEEVNQRIQALWNNHRDEYFNLPGDERFTGTAASEFNEELQNIQRRMDDQTDVIMQKESDCDRWERHNRNCGGCADWVLERCYSELERERRILEELRCEQAKLQGMEDGLENCR